MTFSKIIFSILMVQFLIVGCSNQTYVQKHKGDDRVQSLSTINEIATDFIISYNKENSTNWQSLEPNPKTIVSRCLTPLKASWGKQTLADVYPKQTLDGTNWHIEVSCSQTVSKEQDNKGWIIIVPTNKPFIETNK